MPSNPFIQTFVVPNYRLGHLIQWKVDPTFMESEPYVFTVEVSGTIDFSKIEYTIPAIQPFFAVDNTNFRQGINIDIYYRVKLQTADDNTYYSKVVLFGSDVETRRNYHLASEIVRKELLRMTKYTGVAGYLLKRKSFCEKQQDQVDPISGAPITDNVSDYGTGLEGGYFNPLKIIMSYEDLQTAQVLNQSGLGVSDTADYSIRMVGYPIIEVRDVLIDLHGDFRYIVKKCQPLLFPGTSIIIVQKIEASLVPQTDNIYKIALN